MTETTKPETPNSAQNELLEHIQNVETKVDKLVPHILQLENAAIFIIALVVVMQIVGTLVELHPSSELSKISWFLPYASLLLVAYVIKILNPYNRVAEVTEKGFNYAGAGALIGGSITGLLTGGLGAPAGGAIGGSIGFCCGTVVGVFTTRDKSTETTKTKCNKCKSPVLANEKYCSSCGKEQPPKKIICPTKNCRHTNSPKNKFCTMCGSNLMLTISPKENS